MSNEQSLIKELISQCWITINYLECVRGERGDDFETATELKEKVQKLEEFYQHGKITITSDTY
jgi:hypothetical protein